MRSVAAVGALATAASAVGVGKSVPYANAQNSCGNCWVFEKQVNASGVYNPAGGQRDWCVTGVNDAALNQGTAAWPKIPTTSNTTATAWTIEQIKLAFASSTVANFDELFCGDYLMQYKDGKGHDSTGTLVAHNLGTSGLTYGPDGPAPLGYADRAGTGAACVRAKTVEAIQAADRDAYDEWIKWGSSGHAAGMKDYGPEGTPNGYKSSYATGGSNVDWQFKKWGSGQNGGDLPANWCASNMKKMFCHMAFPQVTEFVLASANSSNPSLIDTARGKVRAVNWDSCEDMMEICARRQPGGGETSSGFLPPSLQNNLGSFIMRSDIESIDARGELKADRMCAIWRLGFGVAKSGTAVADEQVGGDTAVFESAGKAGAGVIIAAAAAVVAMLA